METIERIRNLWQGILQRRRETGRTSLSPNRILAICLMIVLAIDGGKEERRELRKIIFEVRKEMFPILFNEGKFDLALEQLQKAEAMARWLESG